MKVSVVMSAYNAEKYIGEAIESILNQTFDDFEFIIIDDRATDATNKIIKRYQQQDARIIVLENEENIGLTKSLNRGLSVAKGEYIARMDADDISTVDRFKKQVAFLDTHLDYTFVSCKAQYIDENGHPEQMRHFPETNEEIYRMMPKVNAVMHPGVMFRKDAVEAIGNYCEDFPVAQDYELWLRGIAAGYKFYNIQEPLVLFRRNDTYNTRKSKTYRLTQFKAELRGFRLNHYPPQKYVYLLIPLAMAYIPPKVMDRMFYYFKRLDPRTRQAKKE